jgi:hypothetical protein
MDFPKDGMIFDGATRPLANEREARPSAGAEADRPRSHGRRSAPLYVTFLGPLTDLASAYLMEPRIAGRLTAIWIGGGRYPAGGREYNLSNDIVAANVVMKSPIPLWQVTQNVYSSVRVSLAELERRVRPCGKIGAYLCDQLDDHANSRFGIRPYIRTGEVWFLGDSPAVGLLLCDHEFEYDWVPAPEITSDMAYLHTGKHRPIRVYRSIDTRFIMEDFYAKLELFANKGEGKK